MAVGDIVPVPGAQFEETLASASPDMLPEMVRGVRPPRLPRRPTSSPVQLQAGREWDRWEIRDAWAAGPWVRLIYAKQEAAEGGSQQLDRLATEIDERLDHAALR